MKIYKDKDLTELIETQTIDFGVGLAGESHEYTLYLYNNDSVDMAGLSFEIKPIVNKAFEKKIAEELKIIQAPKKIASHTVEELKLQWDASVNLKSGLKAELHINGFEIWS